jgi:tetratricopeptide (TPR) repeat protein
MGDFRAARELYIDALRAARERSDLRGLSYVLSNLGLLYVRMGELEGVQPMLEEALSVAEELRDPYCQVNARSDLGHLAHEQAVRGQGELDQQRLREAHAWHSQALRRAADRLRASLNFRRMPMQTRRVERWLGPALEVTPDRDPPAPDALIARALQVSTPTS